MLAPQPALLTLPPDMPAYSLMEKGKEVLSVEFKINLLAPGSGELLKAKGYVVKSGKTLTVCRADVFAVNNGEEKLCAVGQVTLIGI